MQYCIKYEGNLNIKIDSFAIVIAYSRSKSSQEFTKHPMIKPAPKLYSDHQINLTEIINFPWVGLSKDPIISHHFIANLYRFTLINIFKYLFLHIVPIKLEKLLAKTIFVNIFAKNNFDF
jgi:hypothetical protein